MTDPTTTFIPEPPVGAIIDTYTFELTRPFTFYLKTIDQWSTIPTGFRCDLETEWIIRGTCPYGGIIHDYFSRKDSKPTVSKKTAADIYKEVMIYRNVSPWRTHLKHWIVRTYPNYFHKKEVLST